MLFCVNFLVSKACSTQVRKASDFLPPPQIFYWPGVTVCMGAGTQSVPVPHLSLGVISLSVK